MAEHRIAAVTSTRADFGLMRWVLQGIERDPDLRLQLVVTGAHLAPEFGRTRADIEAFGLPIADEVEILVSSDTGVGTAKSVGLAVIGLADAFRRLRPSVVVLLGDRFEIFAAGVAATAMSLPIAHLCGGESTEGAIDQVWRAGLSKMAHLHLVAAEPYGAAVRALGEDPERIHVVGSPGIESFRHLARLDRAALGAALGIALEPPVVIVAFHPVTRPAPGEPDTAAQADAVFAALAGEAATYVVTYANADAGGRAINERIQRFAAERPRVLAVPNLPADRFLQLMCVADAMVGNSSSGLIEAPSAGLPVVNVGSRQSGRLRAANVLDVEPTTAAIAAGLRRALDPAFRARLQGLVNPYGDGRTSERVVALLKHLCGTPALQVKR